MFADFMRITVTLVFMAISLHLAAQQSAFVKYGKVSVDDLRVKTYNIDSGAGAVVLSDIGHVKINGNNKGSFTISYTRHKVVHILKRSAYDLANVQIPLFSEGDRVEKLEKLKAHTYNLENGKISETRFDKSGLYTDRIDRNWMVSKFTLPNVKEGSIIEFEFEVSSDFLRHVGPWNFQGQIPQLWSEFDFSAPSFFGYTFLSHGYHPLFIQDKKSRVENFAVTLDRKFGGYVTNAETVTFTAGVTDYRWVMKDVPALKFESFTSALENHTARMEFQLAATVEPLETRNYIQNWADLTQELDNSDFFGAVYKETESWIPADFKQVAASGGSKYEQALKIYEYVRNNFICTGNKGIYFDGTIRNLVKSKKGTASEINLMLTGMLRSAGLISNPVILSTTSNGYVYKEYPSLASFNYVIVLVEVEGKKYYLDASQPLLGFGKLLPECYNGHARVVNPEATAVYLMPDSVVEKKVSIITLSFDNGKVRSQVKQYPGYFESFFARSKIQNEGMQQYFQSLERDLGTDVKLNRSSIDSLTNYNTPIQLNYELEQDMGQEDIIYFNPVICEGYRKNPFESVQRNYPVEMPYLIDNTYTLTMEVPKGYKVDELPKQVMLKLDPKSSGYFEYRIAQSGQTISLRMVLRFSKTFYAPEEYNSLREFFGLIVSKQAEQIVFKKIK